MGQPEITAAAILEALGALGDTTEKVAGTLARLDIKGTRNECFTCPIAEYLKARLLSSWVEVGTLDIAAGRDEEWVEVETPAHIAAFVLAFDRGAYPGLEAACANQTTS